MKVIQIDRYDDAALDAMNELLPQLSARHGPLSARRLREIINSESTHLLMAEENGVYIGCLTLVVFRIPTAVRARLEDIVVQESARRRGVGQALVLQAVATAGTLGADAVELTSHPSRQAAIHLYQKLGFEVRTTNVYRRSVAGKPPTM